MDRKNMNLFPVVTLMSLLAVACVGAPARFINADAVEWLRKFGYLPKDTGSKDVELSEYRAAIEEMQEHYQIPVTGDIDVLTEIEMMLPRCGVPDTMGNRESAAGRGRRYVTTGRKWDKEYVSYRITTYTSDMTTASQDDLAREAFRIWNEVVPFTLYEETSGSSTPDIEIGFFTGDHGDNYPFDDQIVAHAYDPGTTHRLGGDIHINDALYFTDGSRRNGYNLLPTLVHEIGHALGLGHSLYRGAVMYELYGEQTWLSNDDITGIQTIYGAPATSPPVTEPAVKMIDRPTSYDAIYTKDGILYLIKGTKVYRQYPSGAHVGELELSQIWPGHPGGVDSATVFGTQVIYVYGNRFYRYDDSSSFSSWSAYEEYLSALSLPERIDHVFAVPSENCLYFFEGNDYYKICEGAIKAEASQPIVDKFGAGAVGTDAAFPLNNEIIFVKNTLCYAYDTSTGLMGGPHDFSKDVDFTRCSGMIRLTISPLLVMVFLVVREVFI